jgi:hypothetical protein
MNALRTKTSKRQRARGTAYVLVLCIAMLVTIIGVAALTVARLQLRSSALSSDAEEARLNAQSAIELTKAWCYLNPNWRDTRKVGEWVNGQAIGNGSFSVSADDPIDNDLSNNPLDPVVITATGFKGRARQQIQVTLQPAPIADTCLQAAVFSGGSLTVNTGRLGATGLVATNGNMIVSSGALLDADAEAAGTISGAGYLGNRTGGVAPRKAPDSTVFDYYIHNGTPITYSGCGGDLQGVLLSPSSNPWGPTNPNGIYVIDCGGNQFRIRNCRIVGTLVLLNARNDSTIEDEVNLTPVVDNFPALLVKGSFSILHDNAALTEGSVSLNPPSTPYNGSSNGNTNDTFPSAVNGLVYISGNASLNFSGALNGALIVGGGISSDGSPSVTWDNRYLNRPPPGFSDSAPMKVLASTWAQGVQ